jgi:hypothetical protein
MPEDDFKWLLDKTGKIVKPPFMSPQAQFNSCVIELENTKEAQTTCLKRVLVDLVTGEQVAQKQYVELIVLMPAEKEVLTEIRNDEADHEKKLTNIYEHLGNGGVV